MESKVIARRIRIRLAELSMGRRELAERSGVARSLIYKITAGDFNDVGIKTLAKLADALDLPLVTLIMEESSATPAGVVQWCIGTLDYETPVNKRPKCGQHVRIGAGSTSSSTPGRTNHVRLQAA
jgi:transcriptional regulator with XRE-family HTH domain